MNSQTRGHLFPTREQELLLQGALLQGEAALQAWHNWKAEVNWEQELDLGSYRLLPLLYHNLHTLGVEDPAMAKLKGIYRKAWYTNQTLFHTMAGVLRLFHAAEIETMILKGAALTLQYYKNYGLRPMGDFDVLVPAMKRGRAIEVLTRAGWKPMIRSLEELPDSVLDAQCGWNFENSDQCQFDLHWHVLHWYPRSNSDDDFWAGAIPVQVADVSTLALNPTDQLLHVCEHGMVWDPVPTLRWIADAIVLLNESHSEIEWSRLISQAEKRRLTLPLRDTFTYLRDSFGAPIPSHVVMEISNVHVTNVERKYYNTIKTKPALLGHLPRYWYRYLFDREAVRDTNWIQKLAGFPKYFQLVRGKEGLWQLLRWAASRAIVRLGRAVRGADQGLL